VACSSITTASHQLIGVVVDDDVMNMNMNTLTLMLTLYYCTSDNTKWGLMRFRYTLNTLQGTVR